MLLPGTGIEAGYALAERIRRSVSAQAFVVPGVVHALTVTVSIGVAEYRGGAGAVDAGATGEQLIALADEALYEAKAAGRNTVAQAVNS